MTSFIDLTSSIYSNLSQYAIFAEGALISNPTIGSNIVNNGYWAGTITGTITPGTPPTGVDNNPTTVANASIELDNLIITITNITTGLESINIGTGNITTFYANKVYVGTNISYLGQNITFDAQGYNNAQFFITEIGSTGVSLTNTTFTLLNGAKPCNIFWLNSSNVSSFTTEDSSIPGIIITNGNVINTTTGSNDITITGHIFSKNNITLNCAGTGLNITTGSSCGYNNNPIVCYAKGTLILTKKGYVPIENISTCNKVVTKGKIINRKFIKNDTKFNIEPIMWISKFKVNVLDTKSRPICITKNAFGKNQPFKNLYVSPRHSLLLNGKMVLAKNIVNDKTIYQDNKCENVEYYHLECKKHSAIIANGVLSESYLDLNNRFAFENSIKINRKVNNSSCLGK